MNSGKETWMDGRKEIMHSENAYKTRFKCHRIQTLSLSSVQQWKQIFGTYDDYPEFHALCSSGEIQISLIRHTETNTAIFITCISSMPGHLFINNNYDELLPMIRELFDDNESSCITEWRTEHFILHFLADHDEARKLMYQFIAMDIYTQCP
jgi:hypothetical protein